MNLAYYEIRINRYGGSEGTIINSSAGRTPVLSMSFELNRLGGCGDLEMIVGREYLADVATGTGYTINNRDVIQVWAKTLDPGATLTRYYKGIILTKPWPGTSAKQVKYTARGLWRQAEEQQLVKYYEGKDVDALVIDLLAVLDDDSLIDSSTSEISIGTPVTIGDFEAEFMKFSDALKLLADIQQDVEYGVDQDGKLYFRDIDTTVLTHYVEGTSLVSLDGESSAQKLVNRVHMQSKQLVGGGALTLTRSDGASVTADGLTQDVVSVPHLADADNLWAFAQNHLNEHAERDTIEAVPRLFSKFMWPSGRVKITNKAGTEYTLPIQAVRYTIEGGTGMTGTLALGDEEPRSLSDEMRAMFADIRAQKSTAISLTKIEHTRGEEWRQTAIVDARKQGNLNTFIDTLDNLKGLDLDLSWHMLHDNKRKYIGASMDKLNNRIISNIIPSGRPVDTIRVHADCDFYGRVGFEIDADITDFFEAVVDDISDWRVPYATNSMDAVRTTAVCRYKSDHEFGVAFKAFMKMSDYISGSAGGFIWNWVDSNNFCEALVAASGATLTALQYWVGGTPTFNNNNMGGIYKPVFIEVTVRNTPTTTTAKFYDQNMVLRDTRTLAMPVVTGRPVGFYQRGGMEVDFFEEQELGDINIWVSRDGGTTYTAATIVHGQNNVDVNVSGQPSGTDIRIKAEVKHPSRLYGWGISFKN